MSTGSAYGFRSFAGLVKTLGTSTRTNDKLEAMVRYLQHAGDADKIWLVALFSGRRPRRPIRTNLLVKWCCELAAIPEWLFGESYHTVGDLAETVALLVPDGLSGDISGLSLDQCMRSLSSLQGQDEQTQEALVRQYWQQMGTDERFVFNKLITGNFRIGVSQQLMVNALAKHVDLPATTVAHRITGQWDPFQTDFEELMGADAVSSDHSKPYPFYLAYALDEDPDTLGDSADWQAEWKWDGIRGQLVFRNGEVFIWSRGEELVTEKFPELEVLKNVIPAGTVLDGEIMCISTEGSTWKPLPFALLQTRIGRKNITRKHLKDSPVGFIAYDVLEWEGRDFRGEPLLKRREILEILVKQVEQHVLHISPKLNFTDWQELAEERRRSRDHGSEGIMLKRLSSTYQQGRKRGDWYKWKIDPLTIDGVMIYAQKGSGRRSNLFTDYTFAVRDGEKLVSFAKAYSGLTDKEFAEVDAFVKRNAVEKFGPVRTVRPELVFEIAFEGIAASSRHKSGVSLRFPRINRWRKDKPVEEINTLEDLQEMLRLYGK